MQTKTTDNFQSRLLRMLQFIGSILNQNLSPEVNEKLRKRSSLLSQMYSLVKRSPEKPIVKATLEKPSQRAKGNVNTDTAIFNHPRR